MNFVEEQNNLLIKIKLQLIDDLDTANIFSCFFALNVVSLLTVFQLNSVVNSLVCAPTVGSCLAIFSLLFLPRFGAQHAQHVLLFLLSFYLLLHFDGEYVAAWRLICVIKNNNKLSNYYIDTEQTLEIQSVPFIRQETYDSAF